MMLMRTQRSKYTGIITMQREIYKIEDYKANRKLVYLDEDAPAFCLYSKEIRQFELKEGVELTDGVYGEILAVLTKRARERCLYLLDDMARTEQQIRKKLKEGYYPEEAIDSAIAYCTRRAWIQNDPRSTIWRTPFHEDPLSRVRPALRHCGGAAGPTPTPECQHPAKRPGPGRQAPAPHPGLFFLLRL